MGAFPGRGWRPALRIARREAWRAKGRSALVLFMIALPVLGVTAAMVVMRTAEVTGSEGADRRLGAADARVWTEGPGEVFQAADPDDGPFGYLGEGDDGGVALTRGSVTRLLAGEDRDVRLLPLAEGWAGVQVGDRGVDVEAREVDLADPLAEGLFELSSGRLPARPGEVVVNEALASRGLAIGDPLDVVGLDDDPVVVGVGVDTRFRDVPVAVAPAGTGLVAADTGAAVAEWLVDAGGPVTWDQVRALNQHGGFVLSRAVLADPPDLTAMAEDMGVDTGRSDQVAVVALIVTMALLEVVLLAGPAFAVGARRQARVLALMAATGGTPTQARRVVLAGGLVLGSVAAVAGCLLGIVTGWAVLPLVQRFSGAWLGPFDVPWTWLLGVMGFGLLSAFLAAVVPAWLASRQDVVAVLGGRRGDRAPSMRSPVLGLVLLGLGVAGSAVGTRPRDNGELLIAASAVVVVLGMVLLVPLVVRLVALLAGRMPLALRYAARDAARHRARTVPAVAAVAATVAGVVALGIATSSDEAENEATYTPSLAMGDASVEIYDDGDEVHEQGFAESAEDWARLEATVAAQVPDARVVRVEGVADHTAAGEWLSHVVRVPGMPRDAMLLDGYGGALGGDLLVGDHLDGVAAFLPDSDRAKAEEALAEGAVVVFANGRVDADEVRLAAEAWDPESGESRRTTAVTVPAHFVEVGHRLPPSQAVLPLAVAEQLGHPVVTWGLLVEDADLGAAQETALAEAVQGVEPDASVYVERGYERADETVIVLLVLGTLGGVLMLGGTLTATFLALSDARPDLATMSAVGAAPRTRRGVAAAYALVVGAVGAVLGALVGFVPGIAISRPLTRSGEYLVVEGSGMVSGMPEATGPFLDVPWLLVGALVVALPLLTSAVVGLTARSRLPLAVRVD